MLAGGTDTLEGPYALSIGYKQVSAPFGGKVPEPSVGRNDPALLASA